MILITGGAGFIGSALVWKLNQLGEEEIIVVDELGIEDKWKNLNGLKFVDFYNKDEFIDLIIEDAVPFEFEALIHMGACTSTTEKDADYLMHNNYRYSQELAKYCMTHKIRFLYASSAATYGDGLNGFLDDQKRLNELRPLNMYGYSKHLFDLWVHRIGLIEEVVGLKFFNVFGPNEYHKDDMRSVVHKAFEQIMEEGKVKLFKSYDDKFKDGEQLRDFIYVKDAVSAVVYFLQNRSENGIYNVGSGKARTWNDLVQALFDSLDKPVNIEYIDMPLNLRNKYQYFTEADLTKLNNAGFKNSTISLEEGIDDYVKNYLLKYKYLAY
ncbi:ADP-glyceromanno-heptose 6-epimerase [Bacteroidota bacterium]